MSLLARAATKLTSRVPMMPVGGSGILLTGGAGLTTRDRLQHLQTYQSIGWLFAVVGKITEGTALVKWGLYTKPVIRDGERMEITTHPALTLWRRPNPFFTRNEFVETFQQHIDLVGEGWWLVITNGSGTPIELWPIRPDRIRPIPHPTEYLSGYIYKNGSEEVPLEIDDVIQLKRSNPVDLYRGLGPVQAMMVDLDSERYTAQWNRNFFQNSAEPGGIIEYDAELSDEQWDNLVKRWNAQHKGVSNSHRVAVIEKGKWKDNAFSQRDMQFKDLRLDTRDRILGIYGMPRHILGITEDVNRANADAAEFIFSQWLIKPRLERIKQKLNTELLPMFGAAAERLEFDYEDPTPENRELALKAAIESFEVSLITRDEGRAMIGQPPAAEGGDEYISIPNEAGGGIPGAGPLSNPEQEMYRGRMRQRALRSTELERIEERMSREWTRRWAEERKRLIAHIEDQ